MFDILDTDLNLEFEFSKESIAIVALFHDLCKIGYYEVSSRNTKDAVIFLSDLTGTDFKFEGMTKFADTISNIEVGTEHRIRVSYDDKDKDQKFPKLSVVKPIAPVEDLGLIEF